MLLFDSKSSSSFFEKTSNFIFYHLIRAVLLAAKVEVSHHNGKKKIPAVRGVMIEVPILAGEVVVAVVVVVAVAVAAVVEEVEEVSVR